MGSLIFLAFKSLLRSRLSLLMLLLAVACGVGFQIPNTANLEGYTKELFEKGVVNSIGHIVISPKETEPLGEIGATLERIRSLPFVRSVTARYVQGGVLLVKEAFRPARIVGLDPATEEATSAFCSRIKEGRCFSADGPREVVLGRKIADNMHVGVGDRVRLVVPYQEMGEVEYIKEKFHVSGILNPVGGISSVDQGVFVQSKDLFELLQTKDEATDLHVFVDDPSRIEEYSSQLSSAVGEARVQPWWEVDSFVADAIAGNRSISNISMAMVILAVLIPVLAMLTIHVLHERRQIATLAAIGFSRSALFLLYLAKATLIGLFGSGLGVGLGVGLCAYFNRHPLFNHEGFVVRPDLNLGTLLIPVLILFCVTLVAGMIPALKAAFANPSLQLREE